MTTATTTTATPASHPPQAALARLQALQTRLDALRTSVPTLVATLSAPEGPSKPNPGDLYATFEVTARKALKDVGRLREEWGQEETGRVLRRGRRGVQGVVGGDEAAWSEDEEVVSVEEGQEELEGDGADVSVEGVVEEVRHQGLFKNGSEVWVGEGGVVEVRLETGEIPLRFHVNKAEDGERNRIWRVVCEDQRHLASSITRVMGSRSRRMDLSFTLVSIISCS